MIYKITDDCVGCESCVSECPNKAIASASGKCQIISSKCDGCAKCAEICPVSAIIKA